MDTRWGTRQVEGGRRLLLWRITELARPEEHELMFDKERFEDFVHPQKGLKLRSEIESEEWDCKAARDYMRELWSVHIGQDK